MNSLPLTIAGILPGGGEWLWILVIVLVLFGGAKLPSLAKGLGQSIKEFKKASKDDEPAAAAPKVEEVKKTAAPEPTKAPGAN